MRMGMVTTFSVNPLVLFIAENLSVPEISESPGPVRKTLK